MGENLIGGPAGAAGAGAAGGAPIRVLIADDEAGMRLLLRKAIEKHSGFAVCAQAHAAICPHALQPPDRSRVRADLCEAGVQRRAAVAKL